MRVYAPRGRRGEAAYAVRVSPEILERLEAYFGIPYPYEKLDLLAVPLMGGAMENAGLVTETSRLLLARTENESLVFQQSFAYTAAHEFAHQWFGDLVTLTWWNDTWLNEAFATWMENKTIDAWAPSWGAKVWDVTDRSGAARADTLATARTIRQPSETYDDIEDAFDTITYQKGAAVIRMFESYLGPEKFQQGVQRYLRAHADGNATAADFLAAISEATGQDVAPAFNTFLDQSGVPQLTVQRSCEKGQTPALRLSQERLLPVGTRAKDDRRWQLPVCARWTSAREKHRTCTLMTSETATLALDGGPCPTWVLPNAEYAGYYRLNLKGNLLQTLVTLGLASLTTPETVGLLGDVNALVNAGRYPAGEGMELSTHFARARERRVVEEAIALAGVRSDFLEGSAARAYPAWVRKHFGSRARALGMEPRPREDEDTRLLRPRLVTFVAVSGEDAKLIASARAMAERWLKDPATVDPDVALSALIIAGRFGDAGLHATLVDRLKTSPDRATRDRLVIALASFRDPALVKANLALVEAAPVDPRELTVLLRGSRTSSPPLVGPLAWPDTRELVFRFVNEHFDVIASRLPEGSAGQLLLLQATFCDTQHRAAVEAAFGPRAEKVLGGKRTLAQTLEYIDLCIADRAVQLPSITRYLARSAQ